MLFDKHELLIKAESVDMLSDMLLESEMRYEIAVASDHDMFFNITQTETPDLSCCRCNECL